MTSLLWSARVLVTLAPAVLCSAVAVDINVQCDGECDVYVDGERKYQSISAEKTITVPAGGRVVAIKGTQTGDPATGYIETWPVDVVLQPEPYTSDATWKCSAVEEAGWETPRFNETHWAHAGVVPMYSSHWGKRQQRRIWSRSSSWTVFCRLWMPNEPTCNLGNVADRMECGNVTVHQGECEHRGCCYEENAPIKCYYNLNVLPVDVNSPIVSNKVPREYVNFGLAQTSKVTANYTENKVVGAFRQGSLQTCFRACLLTSCRSMYRKASLGCVMYKLPEPLILIREPGWDFYSEVPI